MQQKKRSVFFVSDRTGITAEALGQSLLTQFDNIIFEKNSIPFIDSLTKAEKAAEQVRKACQKNGQPALIFSTQINDEYRQLLAKSGGIMFDFFETFISKMEKSLDHKSSHAAGQSHGIDRSGHYYHRIDSINFALGNDDGARINNYQKADIILIGVSRTGKTPTCLFLAQQYGIYAANYPLVDEDLAAEKLPSVLLPYQKKLFALTIQATRLHAIRSKRRENSRYATLSQCQFEVHRSEEIYHNNNVAFLDTTQTSIEEIATKILQKTKLKRHY